MSGGHFDYEQYRLRDIADQIECLVANNGTVDRDGWGHAYPADVIERFKETVHTLLQAQEMVTRVDWLVSGDDSEESFHSRWKTEVRSPCRTKSCATWRRKT